MLGEMELKNFVLFCRVTAKFRCSEIPGISLVMAQHSVLFLIKVNFNTKLSNARSN